MRVAVIVDAYSSGQFLAPEFKEHGLACVHVQSTKEIYHVFLKSFFVEHFVENIPYDNNFAALIARLAHYTVVAVVAGTETGVHLADQLSEALKLKTNGTERSLARRNKFVMLETLRAHGIAVAQQFKSTRAQDLIAFKDSMGLSKVVVKPVESAGSEDVRICTTSAEVERAHHAIVGKVNMLGLMNEEAIVQEFLEGNEYFINSVSLHGTHVVSDMWTHNKRPLNGYDFVYDRAELCAMADPMEQEIIAYNEKALDALGILFGPSHTEIIMTKNGPRMVEMGARLQGMLLPQMSKVCIGFGPLDLMVDCYVDEPRFLNKAQTFSIKKFAMRVNLISDRSGVLTMFTGLDAIKALPSFFYVRTIAEVGQRIEKTVNYFTVPAFVVLISEDRDQLFEDYQTIRMLEQEGCMLAYE